MCSIVPSGQIEISRAKLREYVSEFLGMNNKTWVTFCEVEFSYLNQLMMKIQYCINVKQLNEIYPMIKVRYKAVSKHIRCIIIRFFCRISLLK